MYWEREGGRAAVKVKRGGVMRCELGSRGVR